ncbi:MAG: bifunctional 3,4-dihydroxy-2-butanone-4-phosphate synthase/GTP cyclohydrolase II [Pseudomonadota bacterium]
MKHKLASIGHALEAFRSGRMVILVDDEGRENEGDLTLAAEKVTPEAINFMSKHARGLICLSLTEERCDQLKLPQMVNENTSRFGTAFTVSIEAKEGVTTGISAYDRAHTIRTAIDDDARPEALARPGHIFPLRAREGGVLVRSGQTEGSVDLARLAGFQPAAVICEIMKSDGTMARMPELTRFSKRHGIPILQIADLIAYRLRNESLVKEVASSRLPSIFGAKFRVRLFESEIDKFLHVALIHGDVRPEDPTLVRVHSECFTGDVLGSLRCDCREQLHMSLEQIAKAPSGVLLYIRQEGRGIGLVNKIRAYELQDEGHDTVTANEKLGFKADLREYGVGAQILTMLGVRKMKLLTNNPRKIVGLEGYGLKVVERVPIAVSPNPNNLRYLTTKKKRLGHLLDLKG